MNIKQKTNHYFVVSLQPLSYTMLKMMSFCFLIEHELEQGCPVDTQVSLEDMTWNHSKLCETT